MAVAREPVVTEAQESATAAATIRPQRWSEIMVAFVDDPRDSVKMAADAVDEAIDEFVNSVRARQHDLAATWQGAGADTEAVQILQQLAITLEHAHDAHSCAAGCFVQRDPATLAAIARMIQANQVPMRACAPGPELVHQLALEIG